MSEVRDLVLQPLEPEAFAPYGDVLAGVGEPAAQTGWWRFWRASTYEHERGTVKLSVWTVERIPFVVDELERHLLETQAYVPRGTPYAIVVAPPSAGDMPDLDRLTAFSSDGTRGFRLHRGTWHHYPFALHESASFVTIHAREGGTADDMDMREDFEQLTGVRFRLVL